MSDRRPDHARPGPRIGSLRARVVHRVTPDDVGERVSIRALVDDPQRGEVPSDVVGRLVGGDAETLLVVDRQGTLHLIDAARILSSRLVPPHPRLPPEPAVGTVDAPLERAAARVLLLDASGQVLLVAHAPSAERRVWTAPGGGLRPGEDHRSAAARELREELGLALDLGPWVWSRRERFVYRGCWLDQDERWYLARMERWDPATAPLDDVGLVGARWWSVPALRETDAEVAPAALAEHLARLLDDGPPPQPVDVGR